MYASPIVGPMATTPWLASSTARLPGWARNVDSACSPRSAEPGGAYSVTSTRSARVAMLSLQMNGRSRRATENAAA